jgi:hypothetical protein
MLTNRIRNKKGKGYILEEEKKKEGKVCIGFAG